MTSYFINHTLREIRQTLSHAREEITAALRKSIQSNEGWSYADDIELFEKNVDLNGYVVNLVLESSYDCPDYALFVNELDLSEIM